jgi:hypothetical protein
MQSFALSGDWIILAIAKKGMLEVGFWRDN